MRSDRGAHGPFTLSNPYSAANGGAGINPDPTELLYRLSPRFASIAMLSAFASPRLSKLRYPSWIILVTTFGVILRVRTSSPSFWRLRKML